MHTVVVWQLMFTKNRFISTTEIIHVISFVTLDYSKYKIDFLHYVCHL